MGVIDLSASRRGLGKGGIVSIVLHGGTFWSPNKMYFRFSFCFDGNFILKILFVYE